MGFRERAGRVSRIFDVAHQGAVLVLLGTSLALVGAIGVNVYTRTRARRERKEAAAAAAPAS